MRIVYLALGLVFLSSPAFALMPASIARHNDRPSQSVSQGSSHHEPSHARSSRDGERSSP